MTTDIEYALMAGASYISTRHEINRFPVSSGWLEKNDERRNDPVTGFEATYFTKGTEIVISYSGTDPENWSPITTPDGLTNSALSAGKWADQLMQAAEYYLAVKASAPLGATITLTGHSLGGGLAALIGVFFGVRAKTFDQAPFAASARFEPGNSDWRSNAEELLARLSGRYDPTKLTELAEYVRLLNADIFGNVIPRANLIDTARVQGEFLEGGFAGGAPIGNPDVLLTHGPGGDDKELHSQALLAAFLQSNQSAATAGTPSQNMSEVSKKLTDLLKMLFDKSLYDRKTGRSNSTDVNFLEHLVRHEAGLRDPATGTTTMPADAMVTRFTRDLWKLAQDGGLTLSSSDLSKTLIAFAMQKYYDETQTSPGYNKTLFTDVSGVGGIQFDRADVVANPKEAKGDTYFQSYLATAFTPEDRRVIDAILPALRDWFIQAGSSPMNATATTKAALMLGGSGADTLTGGSQADLLLGQGGVDTLQGGDGADTLVGGKDNDTLTGGTGEDTYLINPGDGADHIIDSGVNYIRFNGEPVVGAFVKDIDGKYRDLDTTTTYKITINSPAVLQLDATTSLTFTNDTTAEALNAEGYGLRLVDAASPIETTRTIIGDLLPADLDPNRQHSDGQVRAWTDDLGNVTVTVTAAPGRGDTLYGSAGNDLIQGKGGDDWIDARGGADRLEGDSGRDILNGADGKDLLIGGMDADLLLGGSGDDRLFADLEIQLGAVHEQPDGTGRELLAGGEGDDVLVGAATADALLGGAGSDIVLGGAGDDDLLGDRDIAGNGRDWVLTRDTAQEGGITRYRHSYGGDFTSSGDATPAGADILYGGAGDDWIFAGGGNDVLDGGADHDVVFGEAGNDVVEGGDGNDVLSGDEIDDGTPGGLAGTFHGADYLDGGDGADKLTGNGGNDDLFGGAGNDEIAGDDTVTHGQYHGADYLDGEDDNDQLWGQGGNDELFGGAGNDHLEGDYDSQKLAGAFHGTDYLDGEDGNDELIGGGSNDTLYGGTGDDVVAGDDTAGAPLAALFHGADLLDGGDGKDSLYGGRGDDVLRGGAGNDNLAGDAGNDTLSGGRDADNLLGGEGDDTYILTTGDGSAGPDGEIEAIEDSGGRDTLRLDGVSPAQIRLFPANGSALVIEYGATDRVAIINGMGGAIERIEVGGQVLSYAQFVGRYATVPLIGANALDKPVQLGGSAPDALAATGGNATLSGGRGNDTLSATGDNNRILYAKGDGTDRVATGGVGNVLGLGPGVAATDLKLKLGSLALQVGDDPNDIIHFDSFDANDVLATRPLDSIEFEDGGTISYAELLAMGFDIDGGALADTLTGTSVDDRIAGGAGNDTLSALAGNDLLDGGTGDDSLTGGVGSDTYLWGTGGGQDRIDNTDASIGKTDTLRIGSETDVITPALLAFVRSGNDLIVRRREGTDQVTIIDHYAGAAIDAIEFVGGETWNTAQIEAHLTNELSDSPDIYSGTPGNDIIDGRGGADNLFGLGGNDELIGGAGADTLNGGAGADTLDGGRNDAAVDLMQGGTEGDTYLFGRGSGSDTITEGGDALSTDILRLDAGIAPADIKALRTGNDLVLQIVGSADQIKVTGAYAVGAGAAARIERIEFADTTAWTEADIRQRILEGLATAANDGIIGFDGNDTMLGLGGADTLLGLAGNDTLDGGDGNDTLLGGDGNDMFLGGAGNDSLVGGAGEDRFDGGAGNDVQHGQGGNDTYRFGRGAGQDVLFDEDPTPGNEDTVELDADVLPEDVVVTRNAGEVQLAIKGTTDTLRFLNYFSSDANRIERVRFADTTVWEGSTLLARSLIATEGADSLTGGAEAEFIDGLGGADQIEGQGGNDTLSGGAGSDTVTGGTGGDTYVFGRDAGADTIVETSALAGDIDIIELGTAIAPEHVILNRVATGGGLAGFPHLKLDFLQADGTASTDSILLKNFFVVADGATRIERVRFADDTIWDASLLGATIASGTALADTFLGDGLADYFDGRGGNDSLTGAAGDDLLAGGLGNDTLKGGTGNDTYRFGRGDGEDVIDESFQGGGTDTLELGAGITAADVSLYANDFFLNDGRLVVVLDDSPTQLTVSRFFAGGTAQIERILFADTSEWNVAAINARVIRGTANDMTGTSGNDRFVVDHYADRIFEGLNQGIDTVESSIGWTLGANLENLILTGPLNVWGTGNTLNNVITGNTGNNVLDGLGGRDTLIGGKGDDTYYVSPLAGDIVTELANEGIDTVIADETYTLPANVENLTMNSNSIFAVTATGNGLDNLIYGRYDRGVIFDGRGGNDSLMGGAADDTYRFALGGGTDTIVEIDGTDQIVFGAGIFAAGVTASRSGSQVTLAVSPGDSINFAETVPGRYAIENVVFSGGPTWLVADLRQRLNSAPTGAVTVSGTAAQNQTLTAANTLADADGLGPIIYQWQSSVDAGATWNPIAGATAGTFTPGETQVGMLVRALASYTDVRGTLESKASEPTAAIAGIGGNAAPSGEVGVGRTAIQGQTLTASNTLADADGLGAITYQWQSSSDAGATWTDVARATSESFTLGETEVGLQVRAVASYTDGHGLAESVASTATAAVANLNDAPSGEVGVGGTAIQGQTLTASNTLADADGLGVIGYHWQSSTDGTTWSQISGAPSESFTPGETQVGRQVRAVASYIDGHGTPESITSAATATVANLNDAPSGEVGVDGTAIQGQTLTASNTLADADGLGVIGYQWQADGIAIGGATASTLVLAEAQVGKVISVTASYTDGHGTAEAVTSTPTLAVGNINDAPTGTVTISGSPTQNQMLIASNTVADADGLDAIDYRWQSSADGGTWSDIDGATSEGFTLTDAQVGRQVRAVASYTDGHGTPEALVSEATEPVAGNVNHAPTLAVPIADLIAVEESAFTFMLSAGSFADVDPGDVLGYQATRSDGTALPAWLSFDAATRTFSGTPPAAPVGQVAVRVTVTDLDGASISDVFMLDVANHVVGTDAPSTLLGTSQRDVIEGFAGNDTLDGAAGADILIGGEGDDTYRVDRPDDQVIESADQGIDQVVATLGFVLPDSVEKLILTGWQDADGTGNALDNAIVGNGDANRLLGLGGDDWLDGGLGRDTLVGGAGNDTYLVDQAGDSIIESADEGGDQVRSTVSWTLGANFERLHLVGTSGVNGIGNALDNFIEGNAGNNSLDGAAGSDTLSGGLGNDTYFVDDAADYVIEYAGGGIDLVSTGTVSVVLSENVENLTLTGSAAIDGSGNARDNVLIGNLGSNRLSGGDGNDSLDGGGAIADLLIGGSGNDTYTVYGATQVIELAGEGIDTVTTPTSYALSANVENLVLVGDSTNNIGGSGNELDNVLIGNSAANTLAGNAGNDTLDGKAGTDILIGGSGNDAYLFGGGHGSDTVRENDSTVGNADEVRFLAGIAADQIWLRHVGNHLEANIIGTADKMTVENWYLSSSYHVEQFKTAGGRVLIDSQVENLVQAMAAFAPPAPGQTSLPGSYQEVLTPVIAANWQ